MTTISSLAAHAALIGDPARAAMLVALMDGRALTAGELAGAAGITPQTASGHLARLVDGALLARKQQGRHHYFRIAAPEVAALVEAMMAASTHLRTARAIRTGPRDAALRNARTCYDHLAGRVAVAIADAMVRDRHLELDGEGALLTPSGAALLGTLGAQLRAPGKRAFCRPCLDWSERRAHIGGEVGRALCTALFDRGWIRRATGSRSVTVTPNGQSGLATHLGVRFE